MRPIVNTLKATAKCSFLIDTGAHVTAIPEPDMLWCTQIAASNLGTASKHEKVRVVSIGRLLTNMVEIENVRYVPSLSSLILSHRGLTVKGYSIHIGHYSSY